jgi:hypothetical protein
LAFRFVDVFGESRYGLFHISNICRFILTYLGLSIDSKYNIIIVWKSMIGLDFIYLLYNVCSFKKERD